MVTNGEQLVYFFAGLGVGVIIGMLFAPRSGQEAREYIRERAQEGGEYLKRQTGELRNTAGDMLEKGKEYVGHQSAEAAEPVG
ncbi:MAG: YtxH domain-containing protein [Candidatus Binatia bacterium]